MWRFDTAETLEIRQDGTPAGRHIRLRPTKLCASLLVMSAAVWVGAVNYQVNVAYAVCFWLAGFAGISALLTRRQLLGLQLHIRYEGEVFAGNEAEVQVLLDGNGSRTRLLWLRGETRYRLAERAAEKAARHSGNWHRVEIWRQQPHRYLWRIAVERRGYFPAPLLLRLSSTAPFGLFVADCLVEWQTEAVVFPAPIEHNNFGTGSLSDPDQTPQQAGMHGEDFAYLKNHQEGTSLQHIAWKTFAKRGELMDKVFDEPPPRVSSTIISYRDYPSGTPADKLAGLLSYRILQADRSNLPYTLELPKLEIRPQNGQREKCLNALALM